MWLVGSLAALSACAAVERQVRPELTEELNERGASAPAVSAEAGSVLRFVNADARPHQIYSNDCAELSSTLLAPGQAYAVTLGSGNKLCHFQDLLQPVSPWSGTLQVHDTTEESRSDYLASPQP
jgi:4-hydroxyphenylpyruvate dioxygenase-like putative hemolysin